MLERVLPLRGRKRGKPDELPVRVGHLGPRQSRMLEYDQNLVWVTLLLLAYGLVMVYSATISFHDSPRYAQWSPYHYFVRDVFSIAAALLASWIVVQIPMSELQKWSMRLFFFSLLGLVVVLLPHIGKDVNGSKRWVMFPGGLNFQPSELVKLTALLYAADFMVRKQEVKQSFLKTFLPMMVVMMLVGVLLLAEPDMGAFLVIASITLAILFLGGANGKLFAGFSVAVIGAFVLMIVLSPWRRDRIFAYLNPWNEANALGSAYQLSHALIAMGRGEWFGVGLGGSIEKLHYLPEAHTDFLLAIIGEELGLPERIVWRQPFPGPGLAIRIIGEITRERVDILQRADAILQDEIKKAGLYRELWQCFCILPVIRSVGVQGDERTYAYPIVIRAVTSDDAMTADWARLPYDLLERISNRIINEVPEVNRVVYDISSKPPSTIEWE